MSQRAALTRLATVGAGSSLSNIDDSFIVFHRCTIAINNNQDFMGAMGMGLLLSGPPTHNIWRGVQSPMINSDRRESNERKPG